MGRIEKGAKCTVAGCGRDAVRSISTSKAKAAGLNVEGRRAYLCEEHYKEYKRGSRKEKLVEKWRHAI